MPNKPTITFKKVGSRFSVAAESKWNPHLMKGSHDFVVEGVHDFVLEGVHDSIDLGVHDQVTFDVQKHNLKKVKVQLDKDGNLGLNFE